MSSHTTRDLYVHFDEVGVLSCAQVTGLRQALLSVAAQWVRDGRRLMFLFSGRALRAPASLFTHIPLSALEADSILLLQERYCRLNAPPVKFPTAFPERVALHTGGVPRLVVYTYIVTCALCRDVGMIMDAAFEHIYATIKVCLCFGFGFHMFELSWMAA